MAKEVPKKIVVIILILAILISSYLTLMSLKNRSAAIEQPKGGNTIQSAEVSLTVLPPQPTPILEGGGSAVAGGAGE